MFCKDTNKAAVRIKNGKQICKFGCWGQAKDDLRQIANMAIDAMRNGTLQKAGCKDFCEGKAALLG